jgi:cytoskeletal protein CcmA (bactofilin family)
MAGRASKSPSHHELRVAAPIATRNNSRHNNESEKFMREARSAFLPAALAVVLAGSLNACGDSGEDSGATEKVNGDVHVTADKPYGKVGSVNGSVHVDDNATFADAGTVNGSVQVGAHATGGSIKTVNGSVTVGEAAHLSGAIKLVNGNVTLGSGADVAKDLTNVNGNIQITAAHIGGGINTVNSNLTISGASRIEGGIHYEKPSGFSTSTGTPPKVVIGPGVTVQGDLNFERPVRLYVSDKATIGPVTGATATQFTGDTPPDDAR